MLRKALKFSNHMAAIGSLVFCTDCGNLLDGSSGNKEVMLTCDVCGTENRGRRNEPRWPARGTSRARHADSRLPDNASTSITATSKPNAFPSALRAKRSTVQTLTEDDIPKDAAIAETCSECGRKEVRFYTQQLRGADEGSTVFYSCECGHRWTANN